MLVASVHDAHPAGEAKVSPADFYDDQSDGAASTPPPFPALPSAPTWFPMETIYDPMIPADDYVDDSHPLRSGMLFSYVPRGPLRPAYLPAELDGSKSYFYCITVGIKVGIVTNVAQAAQYTNGVSGGFKKKRHSHSAALQYFNEELAAGKVYIGKWRKSRHDRIIGGCALA